MGGQAGRTGIEVLSGLYSKTSSYKTEGETRMDGEALWKAECCLSSQTASMPVFLAVLRAFFFLSKIFKIE